MTSIFFFLAPCSARILKDTESGEPWRGEVAGGGAFGCGGEDETGGILTLAGDLAGILNDEGAFAAPPGELEESGAPPFIPPGDESFAPPGAGRRVPGADEGAETGSREEGGPELPKVPFLFRRANASLSASAETTPPEGPEGGGLL